MNSKLQLIDKKAMLAIYSISVGGPLDHTYKEVTSQQVYARHNGRLCSVDGKHSLRLMSVCAIIIQHTANIAGEITSSLHRISKIK